MSKINCIAIDDEPFALEIMADDIQKITFLNLIGTFSNPLDAWEIIKQGKVDLIFLDIQMPVITGTQFLRSLPTPPMVVFTTAYQQYALEGYDLDVIDYLLKPIPFDRLLKACNKAEELFRLRRKDKEAHLVPVPGENEAFFVFSEYKQIKILFDDVEYVEGLKDYVKIYVRTQQKPILTRQNLKMMESKLAKQRFCRVHHSYIVALDKITAFQKTKLLIGKKDIPIGKKFAELFEQQYHP
ncbi:DNA-binding response regulator [Emticicia aquatilis]|uniref:DNA-binding response regulator n=1 Tax=Emticicia aquatilis TaxID=1537369 RepID=A0A916YJ70_9BACT|nr:response regulator transcription factor [Emticicia aquatilis]GGD47363.1 DNA-binding response regulator [Emticicia aquatilis]